MSPFFLGSSAGLVMCMFWLNNVIPLVLFMTSSVNLVCLSIERYLAITKPLSNYNSTYIKKRLPLVIAFIWLIGIAMPSPLMIFSEMQYSQCVYFTQMEKFKVIIIFIDGLLAFLVPGMILCWTQACMIRTLRRAMKASKEMRSNEPNKNAYSQANNNLIKTLVVVVGLYMLCWTLHVISMTMITLDFGDSFGVFARATMLFVVANACVNPFIYALTYREFKYNMRRLFTCRFRDAGGSERSATVITQQQTFSETASSEPSNHDVVQSNQVHM